MSEQPEPEEIADQMADHDHDQPAGEQPAGEQPPEMGEPEPGGYAPRTTYGQLIKALQASEPHEPLERIESPFDPINGAEKRIFRGIKKMTSTEGQPAWLDLAIGTVEMLMRERFGIDGSGSADQDQESTPDQDQEERALSPDERLQQFNQRRQ